MRAEGVAVRWWCGGALVVGRCVRGVAAPGRGVDALAGCRCAYAVWPDQAQMSGPMSGPVSDRGRTTTRWAFAAQTWSQQRSSGYFAAVGVGVLAALEAIKDPAAGLAAMDAGDTPTAGE